MKYPHFGDWPRPTYQTIELCVYSRLNLRLKKSVLQINWHAKQTFLLSSLTPLECLVISSLTLSNICIILQNHPRPPPKVITILLVHMKKKSNLIFFVFHPSLQSSIPLSLPTSTSFGISYVHYGSYSNVNDDFLPSKTFPLLAHSLFSLLSCYSTYFLFPFYLSKIVNLFHLFCTTLFFFFY